MADKKEKDNDKKNDKDEDDSECTIVEPSSKINASKDERDIEKL